MQEPHAKTLGVERFEVVFAEDGDAMICFMGRASVSEGADAFLVGRDLVVTRHPHPSLMFVGLTEEHVRRISAAPAVFLNRSDDKGHDPCRIGFRSA
jgi:hypothetical protein